MAKSANLSAPAMLHDKSGGVPALLLAILIVVGSTALVYWPALSAKALSIDDQQYLVENPLVRSPSWNSVRRFFSEVLEPSTVEGYYHPLSMVSLMLDAATGGSPDNLLPFRRTNLILHCCNAALLVIVLRQLFASSLIATLTTLILVLHPLAVEPVAWISERKTLLAAFFGLLSVICYLKYVQRGRKGGIVASLMCYAAALLSKPTSLPLPLVLLLVDWWPLKRLSTRAVIEKAPFFGAAIIMAIITYLSQAKTAVAVLPGWSSPLRIPFVITHDIGFYVAQFLWPAQVSGHYVFPPNLDLATPAGVRGVIVTVALGVLLVYSLRRTKSLLASFLIWFVMLLPTLQLVGFTDVIAADKYLYLPSIGVAIFLAFGIQWLFTKWGPPRRGLVVAAVALLVVAESIGARHALGQWSDTETLYRHMLAITPRDARVHSYLALHYARSGRPDDALKHCEAAMQETPVDDFYPVNVGAVLMQLGRSQDAVKYLEKAVNRFPDSAILHANLCAAQMNEGLAEQAIQHGKRAVEMKPGLMEAHYHLGNALAAAGLFEEAVKAYDAGLALRPDSAEIRHNLGVAYFQLDRIDPAIAELRKAAAANPKWSDPHQTLARVFASQGRFEEAMEACRVALSLDSKNPLNHALMGDILLDLGRPGDARGVYREALNLSPGLPGAERGLARAEELLKPAQPGGSP